MSYCKNIDLVNFRLNKLERILIFDCITVNSGTFIDIALTSIYDLQSRDLSTVVPKSK